MSHAAEIFSGVALLVATAVTAGPQATWQRVAPADYSFTAMLPTTPKVSSNEYPSFIGTIRSTTYQSIVPEATFSISVTNLPIAAKFAPQRLLFNRAKNRLLEMTKAAEKRYDATSRSSVEGKVMHFASDTRIGRAEFFLHRGQMLTIVASHPITHDGSWLDKFFAALQLDLGECRLPQLPTRCRVDINLDRLH